MQQNSSKTKERADEGAFFFIFDVNVFHLQKLKKWTAFLKTNALNQTEKENWSPCIVNEMMSSEERDDKNEEFVVRPLPWRSEHSSCKYIVHAEAGLHQTRKVK